MTAMDLEFKAKVRWHTSNSVNVYLLIKKGRTTVHPFFSDYSWGRLLYALAQQVIFIVTCKVDDFIGFYFNNTGGNWAHKFTVMADKK